MSEARRLLEEAASFCEERAPDNAPFNVRLGHTIRAYLAMTTCEGVTEEEQGWLREAQEEIASGAVGLCHDVPIMLESLAESRAREGELVAALQKYSTHGSGCLAVGWKRGDNEYRCDCGLEAALAQGKKE